MPRITLQAYLSDHDIVELDELVDLMNRLNPLESGKKWTRNRALYVIAVGAINIRLKAYREMATRAETVAPEKSNSAGPLQGD